MKYYQDTEFNGAGGEIISLALISDGGSPKTLYLVNSKIKGPIIEWVEQNVMPIIHDVPTGWTVVQSEISGWLSHIESYFAGDDDIEIIADWPVDIAYFCQLLIDQGRPWEMADIPSAKFRIARVDAYPNKLHGAMQHNAAWDALALKSVLE